MSFITKRFEVALNGNAVAEMEQWLTDTTQQGYTGWPAFVSGVDRGHERWVTLINYKYSYDLVPGEHHVGKFEIYPRAEGMQEFVDWSNSYDGIFAWPVWYTLENEQTFIISARMVGTGYSSGLIDGKIFDVTNGMDAVNDYLATKDADLLNVFLPFSYGTLNFMAAIVTRP